VPRFRDHEFHLGIVALALRHVIEENKNIGAVVIRMNKAPRIDKKGTLSGRREACFTSKPMTAAAFGVTDPMSCRSSAMSHWPHPG
jgi:hypothetical protein